MVRKSSISSPQICEALVITSGYAAAKVGTAQGDPRDFDVVRGLDTAELFSFIGATQADEWHKLVNLHGGDVETTQKQFANRVAKMLDERGTIEVLRAGVDDHGVNIKLANFKPSTSLNPETLARYSANRLTVTRQLPYETTGNKTLDLCLFRKWTTHRNRRAEDPSDWPDGRGCEGAVRNHSGPGQHHA